MLDKFYSNLIEYLNAKSSTRAYRQFKKQYPEFDTDTLDNITSSQKAIDFYPTPEKCLDYEPITYCIEHSKHIFEPSAGLGSMVNFIMKHKSAKAKVSLNELNRKFIPILEKYYPTADITQENFFELSNENEYDTIICNPPFSDGKDKEFYLDFLFKCIYMLSVSKTKTRERCLIFICPRLVKEKEETRTWKAGQFNGFDFKYVIDGISFNKMNKIAKQITGNELDEKAYKNYKKEGETYDDLELLMPYQSEYVDTCKGFGGTGATADVYRFLIF